MSEGSTSGAERQAQIKRVLLFTAIGLAAVAGVVTLVIAPGAGGGGGLATPADKAGGAGAPYTVELSPTGKVQFQHVPERVVTMDANYNDMLVAVQQDRKLVATGYKNNFYDGYYKTIEGLQVSYDPAKMTYLSVPGGGAFDKELLYSLHADVFHIDPLQLATSKGWTKADVDEIAHNVAPFLANRYSRDHSYPGTEPYQYYSVWELSEKIAEVYQRPEPIRQLKAVYDEMMVAIRAKLPPEEKRPRVGLVYYNNGKFTTYTLANEGFGQAQYRDLGARDAFATIADRAYGSGSGGPTGTPLDAEGLLALNPDVLIMPFAVQGGTAGAAFDQMLALESDPLLQRVNAFRDKRLYPGGTPLQGPVFYLFQIEMAAKQIYPETFGTFRKDSAYPVAEQLFDHEKLAEILRAKDHGSR